MTPLFNFSKEKKTNYLGGKFLGYYLAIFLIIVAFSGGFWLGNSENKTAVSPNKVGQVNNKTETPAFLEKDTNFKLFWDTWNLIEGNYLKQPVSETKLLYGAMAGSVASLGDPHSVFFDPDTTKQFTQELNGSFEGIGAEIAIKNEHLTIIAPLPDSPAAKAGLKTGDIIFAIDNEDTAGMSLDYAVSKIRGPKGTEVILKIGTSSSETTKEVKIIRAQIKIESVRWKMVDNNIAYIELRYFNEDTLDVFTKTVMEVIKKNPKGVILDLRNDPGGFLDTAVGVASEWVENSVVVYERLSDGKLKKHYAEGQARLKDFPTVVLINGGSASGSEIVAGALKDLGLATLIGEKSFGKGSVQQLFPLEDGSSLKLTIAEWLTPNQNTIDKQGIDPDIVVKLTDDDFNKNLDPQLDKAKEWLNNLLSEKK
jgi:carboxyl-terminal processing protease